MKFQSAPDGEVGGDRSCSPPGTTSDCFNQPPTVRSGETISYILDGSVCQLFQSAPDGEVGGDEPSEQAPATGIGFNQPPTVRSGETYASLGDGARLGDVSISPRR